MAGLGRHPRLAVLIAAKTWMAGTRPAMTREEPVPLRAHPEITDLIE